MINFPDWLAGDAASWLGFFGVVLVVLGGALGSVLTYKVAGRTARSEGAEAQTKAENSLIDQLQEELKSYREDSGRRATAQDERMNRLERLSDGYRDYAHVLRSHIFDRKAPPPPDWPDGLPR